MTLIRAAAFNLLFWAMTLVLAVVYLPFLLAPALWMMTAARAWIRGMLWLLRAIIGLRYRVVGWENLPEGPALIASKHQSAWETFAFNAILGKPVFIIKRELFWVPFYGWYAKHAGMIGIDRKGRAKTLRGMIAAAQKALAARRPIVIFPEGTRTAPRAAPRYQSGVAALYQALDAPVVPVALNSGLFWGRRAFLKRPGTVVVEFLPPIPPGLPREAFMARLEAAIETGTKRLVNGAQVG